MRFVGFIGPSYQLQSVNVDCQRCINLYPELDELGTGKEREVASLVATPGLETLATLGIGPVRAFYTATNGRVFAVSGNQFFEINSDWTYVSRGTLVTQSGVVSIADNGIELVFVDGIQGWVFTFADNTFSQITDPDFLGADMVMYQDGYFIFNKPGTGQFYITGLNDVTFDALDLATAEGSPDNLVAILSDHRDLWLFGTQSTEVFFNSGNAGFPFERIQGAYVEQGCSAKFSVAKINNTVFWLGGDDKGTGIVYMAKGYQPTRISTHAVERAIQSYGGISDANAYCYQENGHSFYVLNFSRAQTTWVYDTSTNLWHERVYTNQGSFERHRGDCHAFGFGTHIVGDYQTGKLYKMSSSVYSDDGSEITRRRVAPHTSADMKRLFHSSFQLDIESGTGLDGLGQGVDPQVMLQFSDDGGHTWSNEKWTSFGKIGQTKRRALWRRLGVSRDRVYRITITDPVKVTIIGAELEAAQGGS